MEKKFYWLYVTAFFNIVGIGMIFPMLPLFAKRFDTTLFIVGLLTAALALTQFLISPFLGKLSDRYGRKPLLLFCVAANTLSFAVTGAAPNLAIVFIGMILQGLGSAGVLPVALAYVADVTNGHNRSVFISRVTGTFAIGFMIGPVVGGLLSAISFETPFFVAFLIGILNVLVIKFFLSETLLTRDKTVELKEGFVSLKSLFKGITGEFGVFFFLAFVWAVYITNFSLTIPFFTQDRFGFTALHNGLFFSVAGFTAAVTQWVFLPFIEKRIGDLKTIILGMLILTVGLLLSPLFSVPLIFVTISTINVIGSALLRPSINAYMSKKTQAGQGTTMGMIFSFESLGRVIGPIVLGGLMLKYGTGSPFLISALTVLVGLLLFLAWSHKETSTK